MQVRLAVKNVQARSFNCDAELFFPFLNRNYESRVGPNIKKRF